MQITDDETSSLSATELELLIPEAESASLPARDAKEVFHAWLCQRIELTILLDLSETPATNGNPYADHPDEGRRLARGAAEAVLAYLAAAGGD